MNPQGITALASLASIGMLAVLLFRLYRHLALEQFRQKIFALRDELFDCALDGQIAFTAPAYGLLRQTMNGMIRFGHRANLLFAAMLGITAIEPRQPSFRARMQQAKRSLSGEQRQLVDEFQRRMNFLTIEFLVLGSPLVMATVIGPFLFALEARRHASRLLRLFRRPMDRIDTEAFLTTEG